MALLQETELHSDSGRAVLGKGICIMSKLRSNMSGLKTMKLLVRRSEEIIRGVVAGECMRVRKRSCEWRKGWTVASRMCLGGQLALEGSVGS